MKIVFLLTQDRGGPADVTVGLVRELAGRPRGPEVIVIGPPSISDAGLPSRLVRPVHVRSKLDVSGYAAVARSLAELDPDIIHAQDHRAGLVASCVGPRRRPVVLTFHGVPDSGAGKWVQDGPLHGRRPGLAGGSRLLADALVARHTRRTVAPSHAMATFLHRHLRVPSGRLRVVHNGVELPAHGKQLNGVRTFATASTFAPCKATPLLVETFNALAADRTDLRLMMIGDGRDRRRCEELAARTQHGSQVEFTGFRSDIDTQLRRADVFVLPSLNENLPIALLRAMALGLPCIATDVGGIREVLTPDCGVIVPPGSVTELRAAMQRMLDEPGLAARLGMAARQRVVKCFSQAQCADSHLRIWSDVLRETRC